MVSLAGGVFAMGSADPDVYPLDGEGPVRMQAVAPYAIGATTVTVGQFDAFVAATGYVTDAERFGDSLVFEGALPDRGPGYPRVPGTPWWAVVAGADWRRPAGPRAEVDARRDLADHPVVHVSRDDAEAFCRWSGAALPSEPQWEFACRGGLRGQPYPWGAEREPGGEARMNTWRGQFPGESSAPSGATFTVPARSYPPNGFGLFNTTGNVWEWTTGVFDRARRDHRGVIRGGSHLCHESYCRRYRTSARSGVTPDSSSGHIGFRVVSPAGAPADQNR
jgi:formylglycine-generating enzyme required for sulfatase activity